MPEKQPDELARITVELFLCVALGLFHRLRCFDPFELLGIGVFQLLEHLGGVDINLVGQEVFVQHSIFHLLGRPGQFFD